MRWAGQQIDAETPGTLPGLGSIAGLVRSVTTPEFQGITFHEVLARSALNSVPGSGMPFNWTVNPYRGCTHACRYCFARPSHRYLELDQGRDFDQQIVVKTNVADVLRRELARPSWRGEQVALGTNTDPYQRAEGRYRLMPGIIDALAGSGTPFSILTKGTLLRRDLPLLQAAAERVPVGIGVSLALADEELRRVVEPGVPSVRGRLELIRAVREAGLPCGVMVAPVLPWLTDSAEQLDHLLGELASAGATGVTTLVLHLRPGVKEWFMQWLAGERPDLVKRYEALYAHGVNALPSYRRAFEDKVKPLLDKHGFGTGSRHRAGSGTAGTSGIRTTSGTGEPSGPASTSGWDDPAVDDRLRGPRQTPAVDDRLRGPRQTRAETRHERSAASPQPVGHYATRSTARPSRADPLPFERSNPQHSSSRAARRTAPVPPLTPDPDQQPLF